MANRGLGITSVSELFAMKKNLAYEAKFSHRMDSLTKDYVNTKENLKRDIRSVYNELQEMKSSTGYSLDQVRSAHPKNSPYRKPNVPKIYLPPIGVRLVKKYVGVDVKRQSLSDINAGAGAGKRRSLGDVLNSAFGLDTPDVDEKPESKARTSSQQESDAVGNETDGTRDHNKTGGNSVADAVPVTTETHLDETSTGSNIANGENQLEASEQERNSDSAESRRGQSIESSTETVKSTNEVMTQSVLPFTMSRESPLEESTFIRKGKETTMESDTQEAVSREEEAATESKGEKAKVETECNIETTYNLKERRSSRSTFRTRNSARLPSRSSVLSEHNLDVAGISRQSTKKNTRRPTTKEKFQHFYLDYGDGKLHDIMEIPRVKDCSRPWCNPHCKTCLNRATSRPCFILVPAEENTRKRLIPQDKRRLSMFPVFNSSQSATNIENIPEAQNNTVDDDTEQFTGPYAEEAIIKDSECNAVENSKVADDNQKSNETEPTSQEGDLVDGDDKAIKKVKEAVTAEVPILPIKPARKKGFSKKRINELAMPRGGPPAEVRFSKTSLKRTQEALIESERTKALTEFERGNLTYIQGKISMFLALMNEQELSTRDNRPTEIPTGRGRDMNLSTSKIVTKNRNKSVRFSPRPKYRLLL